MFLCGPLCLFLYHVVCVFFNLCAVVLCLFEVLSCPFEVVLHVFGHFESLCGHFESLCSCFVCLCGHFVSLCGRCVPLCSCFGPLCLCQVIQFTMSGVQGSNQNNHIWVKYSFNILDVIASQSLEELKSLQPPWYKEFVHHINTF